MPVFLSTEGVKARERAKTDEEREREKKRCIVPLLPISLHYEFNMGRDEEERETRDDENERM